MIKVEQTPMMILRREGAEPVKFGSTPAGDDATGTKLRSIIGWVVRDVVE
jgi:hypothetical protein